MFTFRDFWINYLDTVGVIKSVGQLTVVYERLTKKPLPIVRLLLFDSTGDMEVNIWNEMVWIVVWIFTLVI